MTKLQSYIGTPNGVILCADRIVENQITGRIYHGYDTEATVFSSVEQLIFELESFYDAINFPYSTTNSRTFEGSRKRDDFETGRQKQGVNSEQRRIKVMSDNDLLSKHGDLGSFIIRVQHRQNSSWQGRLTWVEEDKTIYFRSIWEMIKLIESALDIAGGPGEAMDEPSWTDEEKKK